MYDAVHDVFERRAWPSTFRITRGTASADASRGAYFVRDADETLLAGDVVTLEPGLYVAGVGGIRIEHNYLITADRLRAAEQPRYRVAAASAQVGG